MGVVRMYIGVVSGWCCQVVYIQYRLPHNYYLYISTPLVLTLFWYIAASLLLCSFF